MLDIILVNPPTDITTFEGRLARKGGILPPLGLMALAAGSRQAGFKAGLLDAFGLGLCFEETVSKILSLKAKFIGLTAFTSTIDNAAVISQKIKEKNREAKIIIGGSHISSLPYETMQKFPQFDIGIIGEGELTLNELLARLPNNGPANIRGLIYRNGRLIITGRRERIKDLDALPFPAFDLLPGFRRRYSAVATNFLRLPTTSLVTTRGCPYQCTFCDRHVFENACLVHGPAYIVKLIRYLQNQYGLKDISFYDDTFLVFKKRLRELCEKIITEKIDLSWSCLARVDLVEPEILGLMKKAGCWQISYGIESGSQKILDLYKKDITLSQIKKAVVMTKRAGLSCRGFFMLANPLETKETLKETEGLIGYFDDICLTFFTPLPGSEVYKGIEKYGRLTPAWSKMDMFIPNFIPYGLSARELLKSYHRSQIKFYLRPRLIINYLLKIIKNREIKKIVDGLGAFLQLIFDRPKI